MEGTVNSIYLQKEIQNGKHGEFNLSGKKSRMEGTVNSIYLQKNSRFEGTVN
jgi:hypothetical protein